MTPTAAVMDSRGNKLGVYTCAAPTSQASNRRSVPPPTSGAPHALLRSDGSLLVLLAFFLLAGIAQMAEHAIHPIVAPGLLPHESAWPATPIVVAAEPTVGNAELPNRAVLAKTLVSREATGVRGMDGTFDRRSTPALASIAASSSTSASPGINVPGNS
eukprot:CAMPEP_0117515266 /NCGR_PEP_ID=MMETSP0784-20121206/30493_1 /TAXON_ID=39447 /ORGANISM="" /LENGTH=158 /DNA_ID=CAMNT_0005311081 /DNA_START=32 /DNA_END=509 /DNA_ORIENTATION=+